MKKIFFYGIGLLTILFTSCHHDSLYIPVNEPPVGETNCDPNTVYFANDVYPVILSNCAFSGCHGGGSSKEGVELSTYQGIMEIVKAYQANNSKLYQVITTTNSEDKMPPSPYSALTTEQINAIRDWINQGAKNNECLDCDSSNFTFSQGVFPIIQNNCQGCHNATSPQGGISLTNYTQVKTQVDNGNLLGSITHATGYVAMPPGQSLSQCKIDVITAWVDAGAPNN